MQLVPKELSKLLVEDIDVQSPDTQEQYPQMIVEQIFTNEDNFPAEKADKFIWWLNFCEKQEEYWKTLADNAKKNAESFSKFAERSKAYLRFIMVDDEKLYGTRQKIEAYDYKKSIVDENVLRPEEFTYTIKNLTWEEFSYLDALNKEKGYPINFNVEKKAFGVTKLGEDHPAVLKEIKRLVRVKDLTQKELKENGR